MMDSGCWCASWNAVRRDEIYKLKYLVSFPNPCVNSEQGETILMLSCRKQNLKTVSILLKHQKVKEIINKISHVEGLSALQLSIQLGRSETTCLPLVMALVEAGADVNISSREMTTPSCISACRGFMSVLAYLIDHGADVNAADQNQFTVLHHIVTKPNANLFLQKLIFAGVQINLQNKFGETPLYLATISNNEYAVNMLLETNGSCVDLADRNGITPLMLAAIQNKHGASVNKQDGRGRTSLIVAIQNGNKSATDCMLQIDSCDVNLSDNQGKSPLMLAAQSGNTELMELLYQYRADINQQDNCKRTSLYLAVESKNLKAVDILLKMNGCDVNLSDIKGKSPLMLAVQNSNTELMKLLHQHNADVDKQDGRGRSAVYYCLQQMCSGEEDSIEIMKLLKCFGAEFRTQIHGNKLIKDALKHSYYYFQHLVDSNMVDFHGLDENGENILHYVARSLIGSICLGRFFSSFVKVIADQRIYINRINSKGNTPLMVAAILYNIPYMQALLQHGCSTNIRNIYGHTVLHLSIIGIVKLIQYDCYHEWDSGLLATILTSDIDVNAQDKDGKTALMLAAKLGNYKLLIQLCRAGADCKILDKFGNSMAYYLEFNRIPDVKFCKYIIRGCGVDITDRGGKTMMDVAMQFMHRGDLSEALNLIGYLIAGNYCFQSIWQNRQNRMYISSMSDPLFARINDLRKVLYESGADKIDIVSMLPFMEDEHEYNDDDDAQTTGSMTKESEFHRFCNGICLSLKSMCRRITRQHLGPSIQDKVPQAKVPITVQNFLLLKCSLEDKYFDLETEDSDDDYDSYDMYMQYDPDVFCMDLYDSEDYYDFQDNDTCT